MATIETRKGKDGTHYRVRIRIRGYPAQSATFRRRTDAVRWAKRVESDMLDGRYFPPQESRKRTVADLIARYEEQVLPEKAASTARAQRAQLAWWRDRIGHVTLSEVRPALLVECRDRLRGEVSASTTNRYLAVLGHAFTVAVREWEWIEHSPFHRRVSKFREPPGRVRFLDDDERKRLLKACRDSTSPYLYVVVMIALATGMRRGEIRRLRWSDVDLERGTIVIQKTKNRERRRVDLRGRALEVVQEFSKVRRIDSDLLFPSAHDPKSPADVEKGWKLALENAKVTDFRFHDLRHTAASYLAMSGARMAEIAELLGHKSLSVTKRYAHLSESHTSAVVEKMTSRMFKE